MAAIDPNAVRSLVTNLDALILDAGRLPDASGAADARRILDEVKAALPADVGGPVAGKWDALSDDDQKSVVDKLTALRDKVAILVSPPGLRGSRLLMSDAPTSSWVILLLLVLTLLGTGLVLRAIVSRWDEALQGSGSVVQRQSAFALAKDLAEQSSKELQRLQTEQTNAEQALQLVKDQPGKDTDAAAAASKAESAAKATEAASRLAQQRWTAAVSAENQLAPKQHDVIVMVILLGALGGFIHLASSLAMFVGNRDLKRSWTVYYLMAPVQGAALAPLLYLLLKSAVLSPQIAEGGGTQSLNLTAIYAFAGLTGLFAKQVMTWRRSFAQNRR
jgi:hypothetical protein